MSHLTGHLGLILVAVEVFGFACGGCQDNQTPKVDWQLQRLYQSASQSIMNREYEKAESDLRQVLERNPKHLGSLLKLAAVLEARADRESNNRQNLLEEALELRGLALEIKPDNEVLLSEQVKLARKAGKLDKALNVSKRLLKMDPSDLEPLVGIAQILQKQGKADEAEKILTAALAKDDGSIRLELGRMKLKSGQGKEAKELFAAVPSCPKPNDELKRRVCPSLQYYEAQNELGSIAIKSGDFAEAEKIYESLVKMFSEDYSAWEVLAALLEKREDWKGAQDAYRKSLAVNRNRSSVWLGLGRCLFSSGQKDNAIFAYRKAENFLAKQPSQAIVMADSLLKMGEYDWAKSVLKRAKILATDDPNLEQLIDDKIKSLAGDKSSPKLHPKYQGLKTSDQNEKNNSTP